MKRLTQGIQKRMGIMGTMGRMDTMGLMRLMGLIGLMSLMACSEEPMQPGEAEASEDIAIRFSGQWQEAEDVSRGGTRAVTRTERPLEEVHTAFNVYGLKNTTCDEQGDDDPDNDVYGGVQTVMDNYHVAWQTATAHTTLTNTNDWEYLLAGYPTQTVKYWDWSAAAYRFFAVTGSHTGETHEVRAPYSAYEPQEAHTAYRISFVADANTPTTVPYFSHLWFSTGKLPAYSDKQFGYPVKLEFLLPLVQVRFLFRSADPNVDLDDLELESPTFKPVNVTKHITTVGTFMVSYPLTGTATTENWAVTPTDFITAFATPWESAADWETVLPARAADQGAYQLVVRVNGEEKSCTVPQQYMDWQPGYNYTYVFKVNGDLGVELGTVSSAYTDWNIGKDADHTVYNW